MRGGAWPRELMDSALCRSHTLVPARAGFNHVFPSVDDMRRLVKDPVAYRYQHADGLKSKAADWRRRPTDCARLKKN